MCRFDVCPSSLSFLVSGQVALCFVLRDELVDDK